MPRCRRCGDSFVRLTVSQTHCIRCACEVAEIVARDEVRRRVKVPARDLTGWVLR